MYHLTRDFNPSNSIPSTQLYTLAIFLRRVLGFTVVGQTNFNLDGALLIASGTTGAINLGSGLESRVSVPNGVRVVTGADIGRILCLKSTAHPTFNSGLFKITGIDTTNNAYIIDYRATSFPPAEVNLPWFLFESDSVVSWASGANTGTGYRSNGNATTSRIILQSPHSSNWQVRLCNESFNDYSNNGSTPYVTITPGFGGDVNGDFQVFGPHLHSTLFYNSNNSTYQGGTIGTGGLGGTYRIYIGADDGGQNVVFFTRNRSPNFSTNHSLVSFGVPDNEPTPLPADNVNRLYVSGSNNSGNNGNYIVCSWSWNNQQSGSGLLGAAYGLGGVPVICTPGAWSYITGEGQGQGPCYSSAAGDSPWISSTELLTVNVVAGVQGNQQYNGNSLVFPLEGRILGTYPWLRQGRNNFGNFVLTTDSNNSWFSLTGTIFLQWGGPGVIP